MKKVDVTYVLIVDEKKDNVLVVKNRGEDCPSYYTLPGGAVEPGETLEQGALREVKEETGLEVALEGIISKDEAFFEDRGHHAIFHTYTGKITGGKLMITIPEEIEEITWMNVDEVENFISIPNQLKDLIKKVRP